MKVLFLSTESNRAQTRSAYGHRLDKLRLAIEAQGFESDEFSLRDARVHRPILLHPLNYPEAREKLLRADFIHAGGDAAYVAKMWSPFLSAKIIHDVHGDTFNEARFKWMHQRSLSAMHQMIQSYIANFVEFRRSGRFLVVSRPMQNWLNNRCKGSLDNSALIRNGVDLNVFRPLPGSNNSKFVVGYAGGFVGWQGVGNLVKAVSQTTNQNIELHLIGLQSSDRKLASEFKSQLGDRLQLFDRMSQGELVKTLANTDVLAIPRQSHPALRVALPTKFAEYLAIGKPVIVSNVDETADLINQYKCGLVAEPSIESWSQTLDDAAQLSLLEKKEMGVRGRELAESEFAWDRIGDNYAHWLHRWSASSLTQKPRTPESVSV